MSGHKLKSPVLYQYLHYLCSARDPLLLVTNYSSEADTVGTVQQGSAQGKFTSINCAGGNEREES